MRRIVVILIAGALVIAGGRWYASRDDGPFKLPEPTPTTISALGRVERPATHPCDFAQDGCFDYVGGWCQAPCATYRVSGTVVRVRRVDHWQSPLWVMVLRDGGASIGARVLRKPRVRVGDRVRVSGVLFFPTPRGRDGVRTANGGELSPVWNVRPA